MKKILKKWIRSYCPNIPFLRTKMKKKKLQNLSKYLLQNDLIILGENSPEEKKKIVEICKKRFPEYTEKLYQIFYDYLLHSGLIEQRADIDDLSVKVIFDCFAYGFLPDEFFVYSLENKTIQEKKDYISTIDKDILSYTLNDIVDMDIFFDKYKTYKKYKEYFHREAIVIEKKTDYKQFVSFVGKNPIFVSKNVMLSKGESVKKVDTTFNNFPLHELFDSMIMEGKFILEQCVIQSAVMNQLNPSSVNTVRCMTFYTKSGIKIGPCFLKVGQGNSFVDNGGQGGILVGIDAKQGRLNTNGYDEFLNEYKVHPDTSTAFYGYMLPEWNQLLKLALKLSGMQKSIKYIGWDFAHTEEGWVLIEGNASGQFIGPQIVWKRGIKNDIAAIIGKNMETI